MYTFQRKLTIKKENFDVWFGLSSKRNPHGNVFSIYLYSDNPKNKLSEASLLKGGFLSKEEAITYGMDYVKNLYKDRL